MIPTYNRRMVLAIIVTQPINNDLEDPEPAVPQFRKTELKQLKLSNIEMQQYKGEKKP